MEYLGEQPSEYLRVELKTEPDRPHRDARLVPGEEQAFEDAQVRISSASCRPAKETRQVVVAQPPRS